MGPQEPSPLATSLSNFPPKLFLGLIIFQKILANLNNFTFLRGTEGQLPPK